MPSNSKIDKVKSRSKVHIDYAEREQVQDDKVGLKVKGERLKVKGERWGVNYTLLYIIDWRKVSSLAK